MIFKELLPKYNLVHDFVEKYSPGSLVDWGCAQGNLLNRLEQDFAIQELAGFDPGNPDYNTVPLGVYDCLVSCDVVEHFEPDELSKNLQLMQSKFLQAAYIIVACYPAKKILADGRNAHLIIENCAWWLHRITQEFDQCRIVWWEAVDYPSRRGSQPELRLILEKL